MSRKINDAGRALVKLFEQLALKSYLCPADRWTIGWGHTAGVRPGQQISLEQAERFLEADLAEAAAIVERAVKVPLTDNQFSALVSFVFNVGPGRAGERSGFVTLKNGQPSTMLRLINSGQLDLVPAQFRVWVKAGGRPLKGLVRRREAELALWSKA